MKVFLLLSSLLVLCLSSSAQFKASNCDSIHNYDYNSVKYRTAVDVMGKHLSGIMVFKQMNEGETRVVFLNEMGTTFFDVSFTMSGYKYHSILKSLNKNAVKKLLAKDIGMLLIKGIYRLGSEEKQNVIAYKLKKKGYVTYHLNEVCQPTSIGNFSPSGKKIVAIELTDLNKISNANKISIEHFTFSFQISMTRIPDVEE